MVFLVNVYLATHWWHERDGDTSLQVLALVESGQRLAAPAGCPAWAYLVMQRCWDLQPDRRPRFTSLAALFASHAGHLLCAGCTPQPSGVAA